MAAPGRLKGALALVTGGGSGIGRAVCTRLAREGAQVAVADCNEAGAAQTLQGLQAGGHQALRVDVGCARSVAELVAQIQVGNLGQVNYSASKAGVEALSKTAAKELARYGIRCNTVIPGFVRSPMTDKVPQKVLDKMLQMFALSWPQTTVVTSLAPV